MRTILESTKTKKIWQNIGILVVIGIALHLILPQITALEKSWQVLKNLLLWAVGLAFLAQALSYLGSGYLLQKALAITHQGVSLLRSTLIVLGSASIGLIAGGTVGSSVAIFQWTNDEKGSVGSTTIASILPSLFNSLMLILLSIFGLVHLILVHDLTKSQLVGFSITLVLLGAVIGLSILASRYRDRASAVIVWAADHVARLRHKPFDPTDIRNEVNKVFSVWDELWRGQWHLLALGSFLNVTFDMLTLYFLFMAAESNISFGMLLSGYALPLLLGKIAFVLPGGVGVVESSMTALYNGLGVPASTTVVVVLGYRLISFWAPSLVGFPVAAYLQRSQSKSTKNPDIQGPSR